MCAGIGDREGRLGRRGCTLAGNRLRLSQRLERRQWIEVDGLRDMCHALVQRAPTRTIDCGVYWPSVLPQPYGQFVETKTQVITVVQPNPMPVPDPLRRIVD